MENLGRFYIDGQWIAAESEKLLAVENPATEAIIGEISLAGEADVDRAVAAARAAFDGWSSSSREERLRYLKQILDAYNARYDELAEAISREMGAPIDLAQKAQAATGRGHLQTTIKILEGFEFESELANATIVHEAAGVCALITPWNWPINQIVCKVAPALAAGCTVVLKPSEIAPLSAVIFTEIIDAAGLPAGVFNMIQGEGAVAGSALVSHPDIDLVSLTGSTRAGAAVSHAAADTIKRVTLELGGKSPHVVAPGGDLEAAVKWNVFSVCNNTGQSCNAPTRMLVHRDEIDEAAGVARQIAGMISVGDPATPGRHIGPLVSKQQFERVQALIQTGVDEGAQLVVGGPGKPDGFDTGYFVRPTVFSKVDNTMKIAREEIFGPVLVLIPYDDLDHAIELANDTPYGLAAYISAADDEVADKLSRAIRAGSVHVNGAMQSFETPFGGFKQSGRGREWGVYGFEEFLETKAINR